MRISDWSSDVCSSDLVGIAANDGAIEDGDAIGIEALNAEIERSGLARRLDTRFDEAEIFVEDGVLEHRGRRATRSNPGRDDLSRHGAVAPRLGQAAGRPCPGLAAHDRGRSEEHTSELQSLMRNSYAVF